VDFPNVLSPFWRLYYNARKGHKGVFHEREVELTPEHLVLIPDPHNYPCGEAYRKAMGLNLKERSSGKHQGKLKITKCGPSIGCLLEQANAKTAKP
jgi:hypothetical protein